MLLALAAVPLAAQTYGQTPANMLDQYRVLRPAWFTAVSGAANRLFAILALIEFAWSAAVLAMERTDLQAWTVGLVRRMMWVGAFYALLLNGPTWIPAIIDSLTMVGQNASGMTTGLSPGDVFLRGLDIASSLVDSASSTGFLSNPAGAFSLVIASMLTFLAFVMVSVHFIMAMVESYVVVGAGFLFLGFGGSRWTAPYVERYIALAVAVGVKIMVLYLLIGGGINLSIGWAGRAANIASSPTPLIEALDIVGGAVVFAALCWQAPKFTASLLGGSPAFSGGDLVPFGAAGVHTAFAVGALGTGAVRMVADRVAASRASGGPDGGRDGGRKDPPSRDGGGGGSGSAGSNGKGQAPPPNGGSAKSASKGAQVPPPSKNPGGSRDARQ